MTDLSKRLERMAEAALSQRNSAQNDKRPKKQKQQVAQLPLWAASDRAIPNHLARSSLFAPIARGRRKQHDRYEIASRSDVKIFFTGKQLDMADCDVFMQALAEARKVALGEKVFITPGSFLRSIGRSGGRTDYEWLHESFRRLFLAAIEIEAKRYTIGRSPRSSALHLLGGYDYDPEQEAYYLQFDPRVQSLFSYKEFALIDWGKRKHIEKRVDMTKWLQNYAATHEAGRHRIGVKLLRNWMAYSSPFHKYIPALTEALSELERLGIVKDAGIEESTRGETQATWIRL